MWWMVFDILLFFVKVDWNYSILRGIVCVFRYGGFVLVFWERGVVIWKFRIVGYWYVEIKNIVIVFLFVEECEGDWWLEIKENLEGGVKV